MAASDPFEPMHSKVEFGVFDLTRLPIDWSKFSQRDINDLLRKFESTTDRQAKQMSKRVAEAGIATSTAPEDCNAWTSEPLALKS